MSRNVAMNLVKDEINRKQLNRKGFVISSSDRTRFKQSRTLVREVQQRKELNTLITSGIDNDGDGRLDRY